MAEIIAQRPALRLATNGQRKPDWSPALDQQEGWFEMDDWNMNPERGTPWRLYVVVGLLALVAIVAVVAYVLSHVAPSS